MTIDDQMGLPDFELVQPVNMWDDAEIEYLRANWRNMTALELSQALPRRTRNAVIGMAHRLRLPPKAKNSRVASLNGGPRLRKAYASKGDDATLSRWVKTSKTHVPRQRDLLQVERVVDPRLLRRPEVRAGRSRFAAKGLYSPADVDHVLVSGHNNAKIGRDVRKGWLRGYWIYTLTLEERATCPRSCHHWATCYGNNMPYARRLDHRDPEALQAAIAADVEWLVGAIGRGTTARRGVLVRLHALGDFFSVDYVNFWLLLLHEHPHLAVYGYTAWPPESDIGRAISAAKARHGRRFAIRWSNGKDETDCAIPVRAVDEPVNAIVCPEQTGATAACATCGLCWGTARNIAFIEH